MHASIRGGNLADSFLGNGNGKAIVGYASQANIQHV